MADFIEQIRELDLHLLTKLVRQANQDELLEIRDWQVESLSFLVAMPTTGGLYRVSGTAQSTGTIKRWSLICKIVIPNQEEALTALYYWKREALVYKSELLRNLPGELRLPSCYGVCEYPDAEWIWLEEIVADNEWTLDHYSLAARYLGQFNGAYINNRVLSDCPWLSQDWLPTKLNAPTSVNQILYDLEQRNHPLVQRVFSRIPINRLLDLYRNKDVYLSPLNGLPHTLCHRDFKRDNVLFARHPKGQGKMVVIDWGFLGNGVLGEDLGHFFASTLFGFQYQLEDASKLDTLLWENYLAGLMDTGWRGDPRNVRYSLLVSTVFRWSGLWLDWLPYVLRDDLQEWFEDKYQHSIDEIVEQWSGTLVFLLDLVDKMQYPYDPVHD